MIFGFHHVTITFDLDGLEIAKKFYGEFIGLPEIKRPDTLKPFPGAWYQASADSQLHIITETFGHREKTRAHVSYTISNLDEKVKALSLAGFICEPIFVRGGFRRSKLRDPFGNGVELMEKTEA